MRPKTNQSPRDPLNYMKKAPHHLSNMMGEMSINDKKTTTANTRAGASTQMVSLQNANLDSVLMFNNLNFIEKGHHSIKHAVSTRRDNGKTQFSSYRSS